MNKRIKIYTDGGSRGNPGPSAASFILTDETGKQLCAKGIFLGKGTNNTAEYAGVLKALETAKKAGSKEIKIFSDSELLVKQINGEYNVKSENLRPLFVQVMDMLDKFENWKIEHISREKNQQADKLVNQALNLQRDVESTPKKIKSNTKPIKLGVLISGGGRTLLNILEEIKKGNLNAEIAIVISSRATVAGVERAKAAGLDVKIIRTKDFPAISDFSKQIEQALTAAKVDLVVQGGWLCLWNIPEQYINRVINIHPALLPSFGGKGMWGHHVHEAVLKAGAKISGCTVHFCTNEYDKGPIIIQRCCEVMDDDTPDTLAERVFEQECIAYPQAIRLFAEGKLVVKNNVTKIKKS